MKVTGDALAFGNLCKVLDLLIRLYELLAGQHMPRIGKVAQPNRHGIEDYRLGQHRVRMDQPRFQENSRSLRHHNCSKPPKCRGCLWLAQEENAHHHGVYELSRSALVERKVQVSQQKQDAQPDPL